MLTVEQKILVLSAYTVRHPKYFAQPVLIIATDAAVFAQYPCIMRKSVYDLPYGSLIETKKFDPDFFSQNGLYIPRTVQIFVPFS